MKIFDVPTGKIFTEDGLEWLCVGDYGKEANMKARFLGLHQNIDKVEHKDMLPLSEKMVVTISTQYGCAMGCNFCDVPKVGGGKNIPLDKLLYQIRRGVEYSTCMGGERLNIHFARMGEPTWNMVVPQCATLLDGLYPEFETVHPVVSTMMPKQNKLLGVFLNSWLNIKNEHFNGEAGLQLSINSTNSNERREMFNSNALELEEISALMARVIDEQGGIRGRKIALNFALGGYEVEPEYLLDLFHPNFFMVKLTPMHITNSVVENKVDWLQNPYPLEEAFVAAGYDTIVFIPSEEEDKGRITCGNALLSGSEPEYLQSITTFNEYEYRQNIGG